MTADIGGYVGLFLGISINQIPAFLNFGYDSISVSKDFEMVI